MPKDIKLNEEDIKNEFIDAIPVLSIQLISIWSKLTSREQNIIISLLNGPIRRVDIANFVGVTTGSLSHSLNNLQNQGLLRLNNNKYELTEPTLVRWLKLEYERKGIYPYRRL